MSNSQCPICCENFNASTRATITCANAECNFDACKSCVRTYLLNTAEDPHCMKCRHGWGQQFLVEKLNKSFMTKDYKEHRQKLLLEREFQRFICVVNISLFFLSFLNNFIFLKSL